MKWEARHATKAFKMLVTKFSIVVSSVSPGLNLGLIVEHCILLILYTIYLQAFHFTDKHKLTNKFHMRENLLITTIIYHYSVPGDVTHVTKQIFWF